MTGWERLSMQRSHMAAQPTIWFVSMLMNSRQNSRQCPASMVASSSGVGMMISRGGLDISGHSGRVGMAHRMAQNGAPTHEIERQGRWKQGGGMVGRYTRGESAGSALRYL